MSKGSTIKFGVYNPRRNLPTAVGRKRGEANFVAAFERDFVASRIDSGIGGRHFAVSGYGIADFVWMDFGRSEASQPVGEPEPILTAFEMKLTNWKRALSQAYRYSYFADQAVVVVPCSVMGAAEEHLNTFKMLNIGLWTFDPNTTSIEAVIQPESAGPRSSSAKAKAWSLFERSTKFRQLRKKS